MRISLFTLNFVDFRHNLTNILNSSPLILHMRFCEPHNLITLKPYNLKTSFIIEEQAQSSRLSLPMSGYATSCISELI